MIFGDSILTRGSDKTENAMAFVNAIDLRSATTHDTGKFIEDFVASKILPNQVSDCVPKSKEKPKDQLFIDFMKMYTKQSVAEISQKKSKRRQHIWN